MPIPLASPKRPVAADGTATSTATVAAANLPGKAPKAGTAAAVDKLLPLRNPLRIGGTRSEAESRTVLASAAEPPPPLPEPAPAAPKPAFDFDKALAPLLYYEIATSDAANLKEAIRAAYADQFAIADAAIAKIKDRAARKLAEWYYLRSTGHPADPARTEAFRRANADWPNLDLLRRRAEQSLFEQNAPAAVIRAYFTDSPPTSPEGRAALAGAYFEAGDEAEAKALLRAAWIDPDLGEDSEKAILDRFGSRLTQEDHKARIDVLLYQDRSSKIDAAKRVAAKLGDEETKKVEARAAVIRRARNAGKLLDALPDAAKSEPGVMFSRIQWLRRNGREEEAWKLLEAVPNDPKLLFDMDEWWVERRVNCRMALNSGKPKIAYRIAKNHGEVTGNSLIEAEFLAGWIALRHLQDAALARGHFEALRGAVSDGDGIARAEYWLGRTHMALGNVEQARAHYLNATQHGLEYYGQLAAQALLEVPRPISLEIASTPLPTEADVQRFLARDAVRAIGALRAVGLENLTPYFFFELARHLTSPGEVALLARLARSMDMMQVSVRLSKIALNRGVPVVDYAFPIDVMPLYEPLNDGVEPALLHALSRQESEFNTNANSPAGARGMMQIMPATARGIARAYNVRYSVSRLTSEPSYNVMLGAAHLRDLVDDFGGSYAMALAAYNAGPGRVMEWIGQFGDPRSSDVDMVDWVEHIPFTETRHYVQKILESLQVFRARLHGGEDALQLVTDLERGKTRQRSASAAD